MRSLLQAAQCGAAVDHEEGHDTGEQCDVTSAKAASITDSSLSLSLPLQKRKRKPKGTKGEKSRKMKASQAASLVAAAAGHSVALQQQQQQMDARMDEGKLRQSPIGNHFSSHSLCIARMPNL